MIQREPTMTMMREESKSWARVRTCEACERAPAAFVCKADSAWLCATCDAEVHSANPLAGRHHRVAVAEGFQSDEAEAATWLVKPGFLFGDEYLDFADYNSVGDAEAQAQVQAGYGVPQKMAMFGDDVAGPGTGGDSVVPCGERLGMKGHMMMDQRQGFQLSLDYDYPSKAAYSYNGSMNHSVSVSSFDMSVVPDAATVSDTSTPNLQTPKGTIDLFSGGPAPPPVQLSPMDRKARVLRYREKKKTRKFEKTIRYASRKAYAETRPRIKGRFAKRTDTDADADADVDQIFSAALMSDTGYGVVPSF